MRKPLDRKLLVETLEDRRMMAFDTVTRLAYEMGARPNGSTDIYLVFDGYSGTIKGESKSISPFAGSNRDRQDILFRVSEVFAPFDVRVQVLPGSAVTASLNGPHNKETYIFVGDDPANTRTIRVNPRQLREINSNHSQTPASSTDRPTMNDRLHVFNSNSFDVAYVDPVGFLKLNGTVVASEHWSNRRIAQDAAHEAGHTFGLWHVRTDGLTDSVPVNWGMGQVNDSMSYDSPNVFFANQDLRLTDYNNTGTQTILQPAGHPEGITYTSPIWGLPEVSRPTWQNSYTYLRTVLGARYSAPQVLHQTSVADNWFVFGTNIVLDTSVQATAAGYRASVGGSLPRTGEFDVYSFTAGLTETLKITTTAQSLGLFSQIFVYDSLDNVSQLAAANSPGQSTTISLPVVAGQNYSFVVGARDGASTGNYSIGITPFQPFQPRSNSALASSNANLAALDNYFSNYSEPTARRFGLRRSIA